MKKQVFYWSYESNGEVFEAHGPFGSVAEALDDVQENFVDDYDEEDEENTSVNILVGPLSPPLAGKEKQKLVRAAVVMNTTSTGGFIANYLDDSEDDDEKSNLRLPSDCHQAKAAVKALEKVLRVWAMKHLLIGCRKVDSSRAEVYTFMPASTYALKSAVTELQIRACRLKGIVPEAKKLIQDLAALMGKCEVVPQLKKR